MFSVRGPKLKYFALVMAVIAIAGGVYITFFQMAGFAKTQATIVSIVEDEAHSTPDDVSYIVTVDYVVNGSRYTSELGYYSGAFKEGKTVTVYYDPNDPSVIHGGKGFGVYLMVLGVAIIAVVIVAGRKNKAAQAELAQARAQRGGATFAPSVKGPDREVYFLTDMGTPKYGHRIEDKDRKVLYEAKMTKLSMIAADHFDFIDHEHGVVTPHLVGHVEETEWNTLLLDDHNTFEVDGEDVWKLLKRNGVSVVTERREGTIWPRFRVSRDGEEIAILEATSQHVHEEDEEKHRVMKRLSVRGFYRIWTREENLDLVFLTAMAFGRSGALDDEGGTYGKAIRGSLRRARGKRQE